MAWRCPGDKPLSEPMMVNLPTHMCITRPQWVNTCIGILSENKTKQNLETHLGLKTVMMTSSNANIFRVTGHLCGEFTGPGEFPAQRPVTRSFGVFFDLRLDKRLSKQSWGWWFETLSCPLWRHCNVYCIHIPSTASECGGLCCIQIQLYKQTY